MAANKRARDSGTGRFVPMSEAKRRPKTTEVETMPPPKKAAPKKRK